MSKITPDSSGRYFKTMRDGRGGGRGYLMGLEWEVPFKGMSKLTAPMPDDLMAALPGNHFKAHYDGGGIEVKTPIDDLGQQKRWVKSLITAQGKIGDIIAWNHDSGIHVHVSSEDIDTDHVQAVLSKVFGYVGEFHDNFLKRLSHRGISYRGNFMPRESAVRYKGTGHIEYRMFNSHPDLLLPALEFAHSFTKYAGTVRNNYTGSGWRHVDASLSGYLSYIGDKPMYRHIKALMHGVATNKGFKGRPLWRRDQVVR